VIGQNEADVDALRAKGHGGCSRRFESARSPAETTDDRGNQAGRWKTAMSGEAVASRGKRSSTARLRRRMKEALT
jgi:hypothetical protein